MGALVAAFGGLDVDPGTSGPQHETGCGRLYIDPIGGAGERLAISAVTNPHGARVDLGFKTNLPAVATAFDFHKRPPGGSTCRGVTNRRDRYQGLRICGAAELQGQIAARGQLEFDYLVRSLAPVLPLKVPGTQQLRTIDDIDPVA